ncbi:hypothetical protein FD813_30130, partial [Klebsiella pneumoniae]|nr:hypothetical protein [Klebsiella pneumoniae]
IDSSKPTCRQNRCCKNGSDHRFRFLRCPLKDRPVLMGAAAKRGYLLTLAEEERALEARDVLMSELAANDC